MFNGDSVINKLVIDFETYFDNKEYTLKKQSMVEYVRDPRFKTHGLGYQWIAGGEIIYGAPQWVTGKDVPAFLANIDWTQTDVVAHNAKFDGFILRQVYGIQPRRWIDTKGMSRAVFGKRIKNHSLATIAEFYGMPAKGVMKTDGLKDLTPDQERELAEYCLHDVELGGAIYLKLAEDFPANQYDMLHWTVQTFVAPKITLDIELLKKTALEEKERKRTIFSNLQIDKAIFSSNVKFPKLLEKEGFDVPVKPSPKQKNPDGSPVMIPAIALGDPDFLDMLESENERLRLLCEARVAAKSTLLETRSEKLARLGETGYWPFDVEFSGANQTHRFSGGKGAGGNPQNFTRGSALRRAVRAPFGHSLIVGDFSNIELRLVAYLSKDPGLIEAIENDVDLYCDFASTFYERTITKEDDIERRFGKCAILGLGYGMGPKKFKKTVRLQTGQDITDEQAQRAVDLYRSRYTRVPQLWYVLNSSIPLLKEEQKHLILGLPVSFEKEAIVLPSGLKMGYPNLRQQEGEKGLEWVYDIWDKGQLQKRKLYGGKVLENISQGLAGELCKEAAQPFLGNLTGLVHDEIHLLVLSYMAKIVKRRLERAMTQTPRWMPKIKLKAELGIGPNWLEAK